MRLASGSAPGVSVRLATVPRSKTSAYGPKTLPRAARQRRSPATISYEPGTPGSGRTTIGCSIPFSRMEWLSARIFFAFVTRWLVIRPGRSEATGTRQAHCVASGETPAPRCSAAGACCPGIPAGCPARPSSVALTSLITWLNHVPSGTPAASAARRAVFWTSWEIPGARPGCPDPFTSEGRSESLMALTMFDKRPRVFHQIYVLSRCVIAHLPYPGSRIAPTAADFSRSWVMGRRSPASGSTRGWADRILDRGLWPASCAAGGEVIPSGARRDGAAGSGQCGTRRGRACSIALSSPLFDLPTVEIGGGNRVASDRATAGEARRSSVSVGVAGAMGC